MACVVFGHQAIVIVCCTSAAWESLHTDAMETNGSQVGHIPVLADTLIEQISIPPDGVMVDATIGHGGHAYLFGRTMSEDGLIVGLDIDPASLEVARERLRGLACKTALLHANFSEMADQLRQLDIESADFILADLGLCSAQLSDPERGLSFSTNMPLDMRIDQRLETTAADIVNRADEKSLADLIYEFGQDRASRRIARFIVKHREREEITTTAQLAEIVRRALARPKQKKRYRIHPATRTFQALRIAVNNELENLRSLLTDASRLLRPGGYLAVISFHSLEDKLVKEDFKDNKSAKIYEVLTKKPIQASRQEVLENRRARSAKLRIARKR